MKILIITSIPSHFAGGSIKSAAEIATAFENAGHNIYLMTDKELPFLKNFDLNIIHAPYNEDSKIKGYLTRGKIIGDYLKMYDIDMVVCMDKASCYHASFPCSLQRIPIIPIIPGGNQDAVKFPPLKLRKTIVFSSELKELLINKFGFEDEMILVKSNRFSFNEAKRSQPISPNHPFRLVYVSRLHSSKFKAFTYFVDEINNLTQEVKIDIAGDGQDIELFQRCLDEAGLADRINFIGYQIIDFDFLNQYNLVVSMGRGVIESSSMGIPVAICGDHGYKGLLVSENLEAFQWSNFTGRDIEKQSDLLQDVESVCTHKTDVIELSEQIRNNFDVNELPEFMLHLKDKFDLVPANGSFLKNLLLNFNMILRR